MDFAALKHSYYHRVATGPFEGQTRELIGSDIVLHLPILEYYASLCRHVTEFGVRDGHSTVALLSGCRGLVSSFDISRSEIVGKLQQINLPCGWEFTVLDTGDTEKQSVVTETQMLFIDTLHTYDHVSKELALHGRKASRFLAFHDTFTCGEKDVSGHNPNARGISDAISEFLNRYPGEYETVFETECCNGLLILKRT